MAAAGTAPRRVGFVGAGRMAEAIAQGLIRAGGRASDTGLVWEGRVHPAGVHPPAGMNPAVPRGGAGAAWGVRPGVPEWSEAARAWARADPAPGLTSPGEHGRKGRTRGGLEPVPHSSQQPQVAVELLQCGCSDLRNALSV